MPQSPAHRNRRSARYGLQIPWKQSARSARYSSRGSMLVRRRIQIWRRSAGSDYEGGPASHRMGRSSSSPALRSR